MANSFINSQFSYCSLVRMFTSKCCNKRIDRMHEKLLRSTLNDYESSFYDMLSILNEKIFQQGCINVLLTEVYRCLNGPSPELMNEGSFICSKTAVTYAVYMASPHIIHVTNFW